MEIFNNLSLKLYKMNKKSNHLSLERLRLIMKLIFIFMEVNKIKNLIKYNLIY